MVNILKQIENILWLLRYGKKIAKGTDSSVGCLAMHKLISHQKIKKIEVL